LFARIVSPDGGDVTGTIPTLIAQFTSLVEIQISDHNGQMRGSLPAELFTLVGLTKLSLAGNKLTGSIPSELSDLSALVILELNNNELTGSIPPEIADLLALQRLYVPRSSKRTVVLSCRLVFPSSFC
jgi:Leucine-rich repeat (LRR) protein